MAELRRTKADKTRHYHILYLSDDGVGYTSQERPKEHTHNVIGTLAETGDIAWTVESASDHMHEVGAEIQKNVVKDDEKDTEKVGDVYQLFKSAKEYERESRKAAEEAEGFYCGDDQWDEKVKSTLQSQSRAALTINEIEPKIDVLTGYNRRNRTQIKYLPVEGGDQTTADLLTLTAKSICSENNFDYDENEFFDDEVIAGRGSWHIFIEKDEDGEDNVKLEHMPWKKAFLGPHNKATGEDMEYFCFADWFSPAAVKSKWPAKKSEISQMQPSDPSPVDEDHHRRTGNQYDDSKNEVSLNDTILGDTDMLDVKAKNVRVVACYRFVFDPVKVLANEGDDFYEAGYDDAVVKRAGTIPALRVVTKNVSKIRVTTIAGAVLLDDEMSDMPTSGFPVITGYAKKRGGKWWGKVKPAMDPQRELNKRISQMVDILSKSVSYGWFYDNDTFPRGASGEANFKKVAAKPGFMQKVQNSDKPPVKAEGVKFPSELSNMLILSQDILREIMAVSPALAGEDDTSVESGVALVEKKRAGLIANEFLYDNYKLAKRRLGKMLIAYIQKVYTPQRIARLVMSEASRIDNVEDSQITMQGGEQMPASDFTMEQIVAMLENKDLSKYDVAVFEQTWTPTMRRAWFLEMRQMIQAGFPVDPTVMAELSDLPAHLKTKLIEGWQAQQQQEQQQQDAKNQTEIQKTQIAHSDSEGASGLGGE